MFLTASGRVPGYRGASRILQGGHLIARAEHGLDRRETVRRPSGTRVKGTGMRAGDVSGGGVFGVFRRCQRARVTATNPTMLHGRDRGEHKNRFGRDSLGFYDAILGMLHAPGDKLHMLESDILRGVLRKMAAAGIPPGLPLHDSVLTTEPGAVAAFMTEESERVLGRPLPLRISPAGPELLPL